MKVSATDKAFAGAIPQVYDRHMVPLMFESYAQDLAARAAELAPLRVLEIAAGTGVLTRALVSVLPTTAAIVATDLNPHMLDQARARGTDRPVDWQQADAMALPFADDSFDLVVCQFGAMFFPDKRRGFAEARRVLKTGGHLLFNTWDRVERNAFAATVLRALGSMFPADPPTFLARVPHGYHDADAIRADLQGGGFDSPASITTRRLPDHRARRHALRRWPFARARPCARRSSRATRRGWSAPRTSVRQHWPRTTARVR